MNGFLVQIHDSLGPETPFPSYWPKVEACLKYRSREGVVSRRLGRARVCAASRKVSIKVPDFRQPFVNLDGSLMIVLDGRLVARDDLIRTASLDRSATKLSDVELIALAYSKLGEGFLDLLRGDFSLVVHDAMEDLVVCARDAIGMRALFWAENKHGAFFSNELPALRAVRDIDSSLDPLAIADFLLYGYIDFFDKRQTPFSEISAVEPGNCLIYKNGVRIKRRFQRFSDLIQARKCPDPRDIPFQFNSVFSGALLDRLDAKSVAIPLSGGLDSSTILAHAAKLVRNGLSDADLLAATALAGDHDREWEYAEQTSTMHGIRHVCQKVQPGEVLAEGAPTWFPTVSLHTSSHSENNDVIAIDMVISGHGGDSVLHSDHVTLWSLWRSFGTRSALFALGQAVRQNRRISLGTGLLSAVGAGIDSRKMELPHEFPGWISPRFVEDYGLYERWHANRRWQPPDDLHEIHPTAQLWLQWANWYGGPQTVGLDDSPPDWSDPFLDFRVISFCFSLPPEPWMYRKFLLRRSGVGMLPESVLSRPKTPAGNYVSQHFSQIDRGLIDGWRLSPELERYINRDLVPSLDIHRDAASAYMNLRPLMLQRWFDGLRRW